MIAIYRQRADLQYGRPFYIFICEAGAKPLKNNSRTLERRRISHFQQKHMIECYNVPMAELKTKKHAGSVTAFIKAVPDEQKRADALQLLDIFKKATGMKPAMWGSSIIGYGSYHYKSDRSTQEGDWPLTGFSPRKANLTIYIMPGFKSYSMLLEKLGKHKISGGSCIYINKLSDIHVPTLTKIIKDSVKEMQKRYVTGK